MANWSSQDLVETFALLLEVGLEVIRADMRLHRNFVPF